MSRLAGKLLVLAVAALVVALPGAAADPPTPYTSGDVSLSVIDNPLVTLSPTISVPDTGQIADVNVSVRADETDDGDLSFVLRGPDSTAVELSSGNGGSNDDYGSGADDCSGTFATFDDEASTAIASGAAPFAGSFKPEQVLSAFDGKAANGTWTLDVKDTTANGSTGTVYCWKIEITFAQSDLVVAIAGAPDPVNAGAALTYTVTVTNNGPSPSTLTKLTQTLPTGATLVTQTVTQGTCTGTGPITCDLGTLAPGAMVTAAFVINPADAGTVAAIASVTAATEELVPADNSATATTTVNGSGGSEKISVSTAGTGRGTVTSSPTGIDCGTDCEEGFTPGTKVTLSAAAADGSKFTSWGGACAGQPATGPCTLTAQGTVAVTATFTKTDTGSGGGGGSADTGGKESSSSFYRCTITGTAKADTLRGTPRRDVICGLGGNDKLYGLGGNDVLIGGPGRDVLVGGAGKDVLFSKDRFADRVRGGPGYDRVRADLRDTLLGVEGTVSS